MFKIGDKVKYTFNDGRIMYGIVEEIRSNYHNYYPYYVYYDKDNKGNTLNIYDWESDDTIEWVEENAPVDDDAKFRTFLEEVANVDYNNYNEEYEMLKEIMDSFTYEGKRETTIEKLCAFYKDFTPNNRKKMTVAEIEKELGYKIEVVK